MRAYRQVVGTKYQLIIWYFDCWHFVRPLTPKGLCIARWLGQNTNKSFVILSVGILVVDILSKDSPQKACELPSGWDSRQRCRRSRDKLLLGLPDYNWYLCCCEYHGWWKTVNLEIVDIGWKDVPGNRNRLGCPLLASTSIWLARSENLLAQNDLW